MMIGEVHAREIIDSRGSPTVEVEVALGNDVVGRVSVSSGASTGESEALGLRDGDKACCNGEGILKTVENANNIIAPALRGFCVLGQRKIGYKILALDGAPTKSKLGANATLDISLTIARTTAEALHMPFYRCIGGVNAYILPTSMMNIIDGGVRSDASTTFQELIIRPVDTPSIKEGIRMGAGVLHVLAKLLKERGLSTAVGDEGGLVPKFDGIEDVLDSITQAIEDAGYEPGKDVKITMDHTAPEFAVQENGERSYGCHQLKSGVPRDPDDEKLTADEQTAYLEELITKYPIDSIEDGLGRNDWDSWVKPTEKIGDHYQLIDDDLFVTNTEFSERGIKMGAADSVLVRVNQVGSLTETLEAIEMTHRAGYTTVTSHRSGGAKDTTIVDIAVATNSGRIKTGSMSRIDCIAKHNQLVRIEEELCCSAKYGYCRLEQIL